MPLTNPSDFSDSSSSAITQVSSDQTFDVSNFIELLGQAFSYIVSSAMFTIIIILLLAMGGCWWLWKILKKKFGLGQKKLKIEFDEEGKEGISLKGKQTKDKAAKKALEEKAAKEKAKAERLKAKKHAAEEEELLLEEEELKEEKEREERALHEAKEKEKKEQEERVSAESEEERTRLVNSERSYVLDWNSKNGGTISSQETAGAIRAEDIAALFLGGAAKLEVAAMLSSVIGMKKQGMDNSQIARIMANTKLINPNIDSESLSMAAGFYMNALEENTAIEEAMRYSNMQQKHFSFPYTMEEITKDLSSGETTKFTDTLAAYADFNYRKADKLAEGVVREETLAQASFALYANGLIKSSFDYDAARADFNQAITYVPTNFSAINHMAKLDMDKGLFDVAEKEFSIVASKANDKLYAKEFAKEISFAHEKLERISSLKERIAVDRDFASYIKLLSSTRTAIHNIMYNVAKERDKGKERVSNIA